MKEVFNKKNIIILIGICIIVRLLLAFLYYNYDDLYTFNYFWLHRINEHGIFNIYKVGMGVENAPVDYPPLFLIMLGILSKLVVTLENNPYIFQFLMKLPALIFDFSIIIFLYRKVNFKVAALWAINLAAIVNSSMWGQTDNILIFYLILMFYYIYKNKPNLVGIMAAMCCLTKLQGVYIVPIYLLYILTYDSDIKSKIKSIVCGLITGIGVWAPFCIASMDVTLPFKIYFGGFGKYKEMSAGAANIWFFVVRKHYDENQFLCILSYILLIICILFLISTFIKTKDIYFSSAIYLFMIYMITFSQRERYGIYFMTLFLIVYIVNKDKFMLKSYLVSLICNGVISLGFLVQKNWGLITEYTGKIIEHMQISLNIVRISWLIAVVVMIILMLCILKYRKKKIRAVN